ncbi:MAG: hypothetical protein D6696_07690 [Acidobacteria bacterium]|nr:MAG: hypothetical protein D6696_07690 [Acidobacteriota bacterium]
MIEIHDREALHAHLRLAGNLRGVVCQGLDLAADSARLMAADCAGAVFLGCVLEAAVQAHVVGCGGLVFPRIPDLPYRPFRPRLYDLEELMEGYVRGRPGSFAGARDSLIYRHVQRHRRTGGASILEALAQRLHDHAIDDALAEWLAGKEVAAIMGGHAMERGTEPYRAVAEIGRALSRAGLYVATGGGPGAMEAGNLGAWLAPYPDEALDAALAVLARQPSYRAAGYLDCGFEVRDRFPHGGLSLAVPTWFYGHEPTNVFASHIAKYFANSLREDGLLAIATRGVIYAPGSAGTVQEIFMDACQNHYGTFELVSPMIFYGVRYWTEVQPVYPVLKRLAGERQYARLIAISDDPAEIAGRLLELEPVPYLETLP